MSEIGVADPRAETQPAVTDRAKDLLDLDADPAPNPPRSLRHPVFGIRMDSSLACYVREQALLEHCSANAWILRRIREHRDSHLPADCREWLVKQAAQCGCPGDPDRALELVLRHLADRWPNGARLR